MNPGVYLQYILFTIISKMCTGFSGPLCWQLILFKDSFVPAYTDRRSINCKRGQNVVHACKLCHKQQEVWILAPQLICSLNQIPPKALFWTVRNIYNFFLILISGRWERHGSRVSFLPSSCINNVGANRHQFRRYLYRSMLNRTVSDLRLPRH